MLKKILLSSFVLGISCSVMAKVPTVVTTIKPLHSLVSQVMQGVGEPELLIKEGSPHGYSLKPSDVQNLSNADLLMWVSDDLETFMPKTVEKLGDKAQSIVWQEIPEMHLLKNRSGGLWEEEDDNDHHEHGHHHDHDHDHDHDHGHHHHHGEYNPHLWLSTESAVKLIRATAGKLSEMDSEHAEQYQANAKVALEKLGTLKDTISQQLKPVENKPYMVFHDAYPYFEEEFYLHPIGVVRADPEHEPGAKRIAEIHQLFKENGVRCVFNEPQFPSKLTQKLVAGTSVKTAVLDPIGADLKAGSKLYEQLMKNLSNHLENCLK
ncbi:zinc ABC transporter substrate-binding protein [Suttonella ornithocola]|uniref:High-affinity zinc uptake system protein ZnuA n=1 Tax=Suttonella ornithocola TaxID=279832 RepID=A0A380MUG8_9GAMM|nr:zinc ABC transporter substrate-binding protein [Suttonella ornithocola]SUO95361.1 High-affinity zinc uptake system protein znuA precursor [Suttonella ornithocola]